MPLLFTKDRKAGGESTEIGITFPVHMGHNMYRLKGTLIRD